MRTVGRRCQDVGSSMRQRASVLMMAATMIAGTVLSTHAQASGLIPPMPLPPHDFDSVEECQAYLQQVHADDMKGTADGDVPLDNGVTRRKSVETKGVLLTGANTAQYEATVGWEIRSVQSVQGDTQKYLVTNFSYEHTVLHCTGAKLSGMRDSGFYLPGYERIPDK